VTGGEVMTGDTSEACSASLGSGWPSQAIKEVRQSTRLKDLSSDAA
jgi:hypothetical protein